MPTKFTVVLLSLLCGCSTTATISRINGKQLEAEIQYSEGDNLVVQTSPGHKLRIPRSEVSDIDHPGNVTAVLGAVLSAYGMVNIAAGASTCDAVGGAFCVGMIAPAAIGVPMLVWGFMTWGKSTDAEKNLRPPEPTSVPSPPSTSAFDVSSSRTRGLQNLRWGMSPEEVRRLYADVETSSPDLLSTRRVLAGSPATVSFGFLGGQLTQVSAQLARPEAAGQSSDLFGHFKELFGQKYGPPLKQGEGSVTWMDGETTIKLLAPGGTGAPVTLFYERSTRMSTALDAP